MYDCTCSHCKHQPEHLNLANNSKFKSLLTSVEKAFKKLHSKGSYTPEDLSSTPEYVQVIIETNKILGRALVDNDLSEGMLNRLQNDTFIFSGIKAHAELLEASRQLLTKDKTIKSFAAFSKDVKGVKDSHRKYLEAEYDFAVGSVQMAERWESFNDSDRYNLQYRTASDDKVRASHADLHNTTLPKKHPFWDAYFPPNGWRCRCTTVDVLAYLDEATDGEAAMKAGKKATTQINKNGTNKLAIFRFNAGKKGKAFPPKHPYHKVAGAVQAKGAIQQLKFKQVKKYEGGGSIDIHEAVDRKSSDYTRVYDTAKFFAKERNSKVEIMPILHHNSEPYKIVYANLIGTKYERKCPDLRIDGKFYEHEGFDTVETKKRLKNMLNRGVKQSDKIIIDDPGVTESYLKRNIVTRVKNQQNITEVWVKSGQKLRLVYKNAKTQ